jgi:hypothetical protein
MDKGRALGGGLAKRDAQRAIQPFGDEALADSGRKVFRKQLEVRLDLLQRSAKLGCGAADEALDLVLPSKRSCGLAPFRENVFGFQPSLGKDGAALLGFLLGALPSEFDFLGRLAPEVQLALIRLGRAFAKQYRIHQRLGELALIVGHRYQHA